jgi:stearoyl-CoA desaturase (Delta-9 desaturase)
MAASERRVPSKRRDERVNWVSSTSFFLVHVVCLAAVFTGVSRTALILLVVTFVGRIFFVTGGYHRYFSHRSFRTSRGFQLVLAFGAESSAQKGVLWWAAHHRHHHRFSDTQRDLHSPTRGFWWSHVGWILCDRYGDTEVDAIRDFARYPELRFLDRHDWLPPWTMAVACLLIGGWSGLVVGFFWSTVLLWHSTFSINSLAHVIGRRRYDTDDTSKNSFALALLTGGEGWHNNHHRYPASARQGFFWWEIDTTYYTLRVLASAGVVRDLRRPPPSVLFGGARATVDPSPSEEPDVLASQGAPH